MRQTREWLAAPPRSLLLVLLHTVGQQVRHCSGNVRRPRTERCYSWIVRRPRTERGCSWIVAVRVRNVRVIAVAGIVLAGAYRYSSVAVCRASEASCIVVFACVPCRYSCVLQASRAIEVAERCPR